jgi:hypothetical protein
MRRNLLGIIALALLLFGAVTAINGPGGASAIGVAGSCIKAGLVLGALWLALPQIQATIARFPRRLLGWFVGKGKTPAPPNQQPSSQQPSNAQPPAAPVRRPRRRSNS